MPSSSPAAPAFSLLFCPHPPDPLPGGKGENITLFRRGLPPPAPRALNRLRHLQSLPRRCPAQREVHDLPPEWQEMLSFGQSRQPRRGGTGGEELRRLRWSSPPGQGEQVPQGEQPPLNFPQHQGKPATKAAKKGGEPQTGFSSGKSRSQESGKITRTDPAFSADADSGQRHFP